MLSNMQRMALRAAADTGSSPVPLTRRVLLASACPKLPMLAAAAFGPANSLDGMKSPSAYFLQRVSRDRLEPAASPGRCAVPRKRK